MPGAGDSREVGDLARVVHAELDCADAVRLAQAEQRERHADVVVEIADGRQHLRIPGGRAQDRGEHFLGGGLAVRAGDRDQRHGEAPAPRARQVAERAARVLRDQHGHRQRGARGEERGVDQRGRRAARRGGREERVAVESFAAQRDEQLAARHVARVGGHAGEPRVADRPRADHAGGFHHAHHARPPAGQRASACVAAATSENAVLRPAIS